MIRTSRLLWSAAVVVLGVGLVLAAVSVGSVPVSSQAIWAYLTGTLRPDSTTYVILHELRLPRVTLSLIVGGGLGAAGTAFQGLFRNPLADPFVIGAASGGAFGAAIAISLGATAAVGWAAPVPAAAFVGTCLAVGMVYLLGGVGPRSSPLTLLLAGAAVSTVLSAFVSLIMLLEQRSLQVVFAWMLGGLGGKSWTEVGASALYIIPGVVWIGLLSRPLDALALGEDTARSLGLSLTRARLWIVVAASLTTAAAVATAGVIGFLGLLAPHAARMLWGASHARLLPAAVFLGAILLAVADLLARTLFAPIEIPVGIMTALMGGPFFLYLLRARGTHLGG